jgi:NodT family efflux transporter outer membrane factor (OMF) lipoprotein
MMKPNVMKSEQQSRQPLRTVASVMSALFLTACAQVPQLGPLVHEKPIEAYGTARSFVPANAAQWPADKWWQNLQDAQLSQLIEEALTNSPTLSIAQARLAQALAVAEQAGAARRPEVSARASIAEAKQSYNNGVPADFVPHGWNDTGTVGLDMRWELDFFGKNKAALAAATSAAEAARADEAQARLVLATAIGSAYAELARLYAARDTADRALQVRSQTTSLFDERLKNGLETTGSLKQAEAKKEMAAADLLAIDEAIALQKNQLAALTGAGPDRALNIGRPGIDLSKASGLPGNLQASLLGRRPDIVAARLRAEAAAKQIDVAGAQFYPDVNLAAFIGFQSLGLNMLSKSGSVTGSIGPAITLPIFDSGRLKGQYKGARAEYDAAVASYNGAVTQALHEVADVGVSQRALAGRLERTQAAVDAATEAHRIAQNRYRGGLATYLEVLNAEDALLANVQALANLRSRLFALDVQLVRALGGGYQSTQG